VYFGEVKCPVFLQVEYRFERSIIQYNYPCKKKNRTNGNGKSLALVATDHALFSPNNTDETAVEVNVCSFG
jgi:hypothetical protein